MMSVPIKPSFKTFICKKTATQLERRTTLLLTVALKTMNVFVPSKEIKVMRPLTFEIGTKLENVGI